MKNKLTVLKSLVVVMLAAVLWACSDDQLYLIDDTPSASSSGRYVYRMTFNAPSPAFDGQQSRADAQWQEGDKVYFIFGNNPDVFWGRATYTDGEWVVETSQELSDSQNGALSAAYIIDPERVDDDSIYLHDVSLHECSASFVGEGSFIWDGKSLSVDVCLLPYSWRIRFKGAPNTHIELGSYSDLRHPYQLAATYYLGGSVIHPQMSGVSTNLYVGAEGYTPYVYCTFVNKEAQNQIFVKVDGSYYCYTLQGSSISNGSSCMLTLPGQDDLRGWELIGNSQARYDLANFIGKNINDVYNALGDPTTIETEDRTVTYKYYGQGNNSEITNDEAFVSFVFSKYEKIVEEIVFSTSNDFMYSQFVDLDNFLKYKSNPMGYTGGGFSYYCDDIENPLMDIYHHWGVGNHNYTKDFVTYTSLWKEYGYIKNTDGLAFNASFGMLDTSKEKLVFYYELPETTVKDPWPGGDTHTVFNRKEMYRIVNAFNGGVDLYIDTTDPDHVSIDEQETGFEETETGAPLTIMTTDRYFVKYEGVTAEEMIAVEQELYEQDGLTLFGKLYDNKINFEYGSLVYHVCRDGDDEAFFFANNEDGCYIDLTPIEPNKANSRAASTVPNTPKRVSVKNLRPLTRLK